MVMMVVIVVIVMAVFASEEGEKWDGKACMQMLGLYLPPHLLLDNTPVH